MKKLLLKVKENRLVTDILLILAVSLILSIPYLSSSIDIFFDDGSQHLMRAYGTYQTILRGENSNIISSFANGFGYSWDLFYGPLTEYLLIALGCVLSSFNIGFKMLMCLILFVSGSLMYKFVYELTQKRNTTLLASLIYITSPYLFTDIYLRHSLGECMAFVFLPMVFLGLYNLFNTERNHYYLIFGASGLILSHNISTVLTVVFAFIYCIVNIKNWSSTRVKRGLAIDVIFILLITSFYWLPFLQTKFSANYQAFEKDAMASQESVVAQALNLKSLILTGNDKIYVFEVGLPVVVMLIFSIMTFSRLYENKKEYLYFLISGVISVWIATKYFPWKIIPSACYIIQFPWRMLVFASFFFSIVCSINMTTIIKKFNIKDVLIIGVICIIYLFSKYGYIQYSDNVVDVKDYPILEVTGQNNEWLPGQGRLEYLPTRAHENTFYIATRKSGIEILNGDLEIQNEIKVGTYMLAKISNNSENTQIELPYIYYPGYTVRIDGIIIDTYETENGFLGCTIDENEKGTLEIKYTGTTLMNVTKIISLISFILYLIYVYKKH